VVTSSFSSEDGAFYRGQMRMEEKVEPVEPPASIETFVENQQDEIEPSVDGN
jgi:hypothetical protein